MRLSESVIVTVASWSLDPVGSSRGRVFFSFSSSPLIQGESLKCEDIVRLRKEGKRRTSSNNRMRRGRCGNKMRVLHSLHFKHALYLLFFSFSFFLFFFFPLSQLSPSPHFDPSFSIDNQIEKRDHDAGFTRRQNDSSTQ